MFRRCLSPFVRPLAALVRRLWPDFFQSDFAYLRQLGEATTGQQYWRLCNEIRYDLSLNAGWLRKGLRLRVSGLRLLKLYERIAARQGEPLAK